jgi:hypothetical protein
MSASAGDAEWRDAKVLLYPSPSGTTVTLHLRRHRGGDLVWERRVGHVRIPATADTWRVSVVAALRAAGDGLHDLADRLSDGA